MGVSTMDFMELIAALDGSTFNGLVGSLVGGILTYFAQQIYVTKQTYKNKRDMDIAFKKIRELEKGLDYVAHRTNCKDDNREGI
jgi:hypothetical protein